MASFLTLEYREAESDNIEAERNQRSRFDGNLGSMPDAAVATVEFAGL